MTDQRDLWNERYEAKGSVWGLAPNQFVATELVGLEPCRILDLGAGQGRNAIWLAARGHQVTAVDVSDVAMQQAAELAERAGVEVDWVTANLSDWEPERQRFDLVLLAYMQAPPPLRVGLHNKAAAALVPGGRVFVIAHHKDNLEHGVGGPPMIEVLFDEGIADDFPGFEVETNTQVRRHVEKGDVSGEAIDLLLIATKPAG